MSGEPGEPGQARDAVLWANRALNALVLVPVAVSFVVLLVMWVASLAEPGPHGYQRIFSALLALFLALPLMVLAHAARRLWRPRPSGFGGQLASGLLLGLLALTLQAPARPAVLGLALLFAVAGAAGLRRERRGPERR